ncbi:hypothetical protein EV385_3119 [Krasilnikovia cinnamomea]|uniref:Vitamin K epoxide reductase family protein n=1 Tax=Krasilnikovia cinnamomea TaxID=349313 RepID=A0A4Q7ZLU7_9ACTN|nr:hypothetical protein [Krasilnikovia cinnamomea]RZU51305.1 hypothetical protein EV385_3119 [Krasilnikovia cinnamomea]
MTVRSRWFTSKRYGGQHDVVGFVGVFGLLFLFAGYAIFDSSYLMSNACFGTGGQMVCPTSGPYWARPLPGAAAVLGLLSGLAGILVGRPVRTPALIAGFTLTAAGLIGSWLMAPG